MYYARDGGPIRYATMGAPTMGPINYAHGRGRTLCTYRRSKPHRMCHSGWRPRNFPP